MSLPRRKFMPTFDFISINLIVAAIIIFMYASTFVGTNVASQALFAVSLLTSGLLLTIVLTKIRIDTRFNVNELAVMMNWLLICMGAILIVNKIAFIRWEVSPMPANLFAVLIAISEEVFFRVFLTTWFYMLAGKFFAIFLSSTAWSVYHFAVYGSDLVVIGVILVAGFVLGYAYVESRRASVPMLAHALINLIAVG